VPSDVRDLHLFADDDDPGRQAAERTARYHRKAGRRVITHYPPAGIEDWGAIPVSHARSGLAA
jgi:hypothetical protein